MAPVCTSTILLSSLSTFSAHDGYKLWTGHDRVNDGRGRAHKFIKKIVVPVNTRLSRNLRSF